MLVSSTSTPTSSRRRAAHAAGAGSGLAQVVVVDPSAAGGEQHGDDEQQHKSARPRRRAPGGCLGLLLPGAWSSMVLSSSSNSNNMVQQQPPGGSSSSSAVGPVLTARALAAGLAVGAVLCFSNTYFGLQTGWVTMGSLQSAILGFGLFQGLSAARCLTRGLSVGENVIVQTTAVATATMPLAAGLVGIIPAMGLLTPEQGGPVVFTAAQLLAWCAALAFFGVFVAVPLRYQTIVRERLRFPSGTATASVIRTLHGLPQEAVLDGEDDDEDDDSGARPAPGGRSSSGPAASLHAGRQQQHQQGAVRGIGGGAAAAKALAAGVAVQDAAAMAQQQQQGFGGGSSQVDLEVAVLEEANTERTSLLGEGSGGGAGSSSWQLQEQQRQQWARGLRVLLWCFAVSGAYSVAAGFWKPLKAWPVFDWVHLPAATAWGWVVQPSAGYIGQGMIMGPKTAWSMMGGAVLGWGVLGPMARAKGWAPGPIKDIEQGAAGWLMWLGLALLLGDCFSELALLVGGSIRSAAARRGCLQRRQQQQRGGSSGGRLPWLAAAGALEAAEDGGLGSNSGSRHAPWGSSHLLRPRRDSRSAGPDSSLALELSHSSSSSKSLEEAAAACVAATGSGDVSSSGADAHAFAPPPAAPSRLSGGNGSSGGKAAGAGAGPQDDSATTGDAHGWLLTARFWVPGLVLSTALATAVLSPMLRMPVYEPLVAVAVALLVALLAVRALGQTDLNPVSGVGKVSQLVFAVVAPGAVLPNLVAGAIAEAGAQQAGDMMQDFKTAHLLRVPASAQLVAMVLGSAASVPLSVAAYLLYTHAWQVPGPELPAPTAQIWLDMAKLVNGGSLPAHVGPFCAGAAAVAAALPVLHLLLKRCQRAQAARRRAGGAAAAQAVGGAGGRPDATLLQQAGARLWQTWRARSAVDWALALLPSGVGFAVGMYLTPNWTLPRLLGSIAEQAWLLVSPSSHAAYMMVTASGLVLGEGCASIVTAVVHAATRRPG